MAKDFNITSNGLLVKYTGDSKDVVIPDGVKSIGERAFSWCQSMTNVVIPKSVERIGEHAFWSCKNLESIIIPDSVTSIGDYAFENCDGMTSVIIPHSITSIGRGVFQLCDSLVSVSIPDSVTTIDFDAFYYCRRLTSVSIPDSVTSIGSGAFTNTPFLDNQPEGIKYAGRVVIGYTGKDTDIAIKEGTKIIGERAFYNCSTLTSVVIPYSVTSIGDYAFSGCINLVNLTIPDSVMSIGDYAFSDCNNLANLTIPDSVTSISASAFYLNPWLYSQQGIVKAGQVVIAYKGIDKEIVIPEGVTRIGTSAFSNCISLEKVTIPDSVTSIGSSAFSGCSNLMSVTIPYNVTSIGSEAFFGCTSLISVTIPNSVKSIGDKAFYGCSSLKNVTIPDSVTSIGEWVFIDCGSMNNITFLGNKFKFGKSPFGNVRYGEKIPKGLEDKCFNLIPHFTDAMMKEYVLETELWGTMTAEQQSEVFLSRQSKTLATAYLQCIAADRLESLGNALEGCLRKKPSAKECSAAALYMTGFKDKLPANRLKALYELLKPVKAASKALTTIDNDLELKEKLGEELTIDEDLAPAERLVMAKLISDKKSKRHFEDQLKEYYGIAYADLPSVMGKDRKAIEPYVLAWLLQAHESIIITRWGTRETAIKETKNEICSEAKEVLDELDEESFQEALLELSRRFLAKYVNTKKKYLCYPISRYANESVMAELTKEANKWRTSVSGTDAPPLWQLRTGCLYNNTHAAMLFAERYHDLDKYAEIRGTDADSLRYTVLYEFGFDETGKKRYNLGNKILEAELQDDLTISLYDQGAQKMVKSVPKKNADPEKYEVVKKDLADIRKNVKKVAKARINALFEDFLTGKEYEAENWKKIHSSNPLLNRIARLLVWDQGGVTFTLSAKRSIDSAGMSYTINDKPIRLAHPMEMRQTETEAWQKYFTSHKSKQPFVQVWEPIITPNSIKKDRYSGIVLPLMRFNGKDKHGIIGENFGAYSEIFEVEFKDCDLDLEPSTWRLDPDEFADYTYTLGEFSFQKYTRYTNHIVGILDSWTVEQRILKDDVSVIDNLDSFTLAQITEFINKASEHNCNNVTAVLLEYKDEHFADYDPMESFWLKDF